MRMVLVYVAGHEILIFAFQKLLTYFLTELQCSLRSNFPRFETDNKVLARTELLPVPCFRISAKSWLDVLGELFDLAIILSDLFRIECYANHHTFVFYIRHILWTEVHNSSHDTSIIARNNTKNLFAYQTNFSQHSLKSEQPNFQKRAVMRGLRYPKSIETPNCHFDEYPKSDSLTFQDFSSIVIIRTAAERSDTEKYSRWRSNSSPECEETKQSRRLKCKIAPQGLTQIASSA